MILIYLYCHAEGLKPIRNNPPGFLLILGEDTDTLGRGMGGTPTEPSVVLGSVWNCCSEGTLCKQTNLTLKILHVSSPDHVFCLAGYFIKATVRTAAHSLKCQLSLKAVLKCCALPVSCRLPGVCTRPTWTDPTWLPPGISTTPCCPLSGEYCTASRGHRGAGWARATALTVCSFTSVQTPNPTQSTL